MHLCAPGQQVTSLSVNRLRDFQSKGYKPFDQQVTSPSTAMIFQWISYPSEVRAGGDASVIERLR